MEGTDSGNKSNGAQEKLANPLTDWQDTPVKPVEPINANFSDDEVKSYKYLARAQLFNKVQKVLLLYIIVGAILLLACVKDYRFDTIMVVGGIILVPFVLIEVVFAFKLHKFSKFARWCVAFLFLGIALFIFFCVSYYLYETLDSYSLGLQIFGFGQVGLVLGCVLCAFSVIGTACALPSYFKKGKNSAIYCTTQGILCEECVVSGKDGKKNLSKELKALSGKKKTQEFNAKLEESHSRYIQWDVDRQVAENECKKRQVCLQDAKIKPVEPMTANFSDDEVNKYNFLARARFYNILQIALLPVFIAGFIMLLAGVDSQTMTIVGYIFAAPFVLAETLFALKLAKYRRSARLLPILTIAGIILIVFSNILYEIIWYREMGLIMYGGWYEEIETFYVVATLCVYLGYVLCALIALGTAVTLFVYYKKEKNIAIYSTAINVLNEESKVSGSKKILNKELAYLSGEQQTQMFIAKLEEAHNRYIQWDIDRQIAENNRVKCIQEGKPENGQGAAVPLEYEGEGTFDGWLIQKIGWNLLCSLVTLITLGIAYPFTICWKQRWLCKHTVYKGQRLSFDGNGLQLLDKWICWLLLSIVTLTIYAWFIPIRVAKWKAKHTHIAGENKELGGTFDGWLIQSIGWSLLCGLVTLITLGIAYPFTVCWKLKWEAKHTVYDGRRLKFDGNGLQILGKWICWLLLSIVTLTIYAWFIPIRMEKWKAKHMQLLPVEQINEQLNY